MRRSIRGNRILAKPYRDLVLLGYLALPATGGEDRRLAWAHRLAAAAVARHGRLDEAGLRRVFLRRVLRLRLMPWSGRLGPVEVVPVVVSRSDVALLRELNGLTGAGRAAYAMLLLEGRPAAEVVEILAGAGAADPGGALAEARAVERAHGTLALDPTVARVYGRPLRRARIAFAALLLLGAVAVAAPDVGSGGPVSAAPLRVERAQAGAWRAGTDLTLASWPPRGSLTDDVELVRRAQRAWGSGPVQLIYAGELDGVRIVLLRRHDRIARFTTIGHNPTTGQPSTGSTGAQSATTGQSTPAGQGTPDGHGTPDGTPAGQGVTGSKGLTGGQGTSGGKEAMGAQGAAGGPGGQGAAGGQGVTGGREVVGGQGADAGRDGLEVLPAPRVKPDGTSPLKLLLTPRGSRYLVPPWVTEVSAAALSGGEPRWRKITLKDGVTAPIAPDVTGSAASGQGCWRGPVLRLRAPEIAHGMPYTMLDFGRLSSASATYQPPPPADVNRYGPWELDALEEGFGAWRALGCVLDRPSGEIQAATAWEFWAGRLPEGVGGRWMCLRLSDATGGNSVRAVLVTRRGGRIVGTATAARTGTWDCSRLSRDVVAGAMWTAPSGRRYFVSAGSRRVVRITLAGRESTGRYAAKATSAAPALSAVNEHGDKVPVLR
ncbi:hypothetical protein ACFWY5_40270 [Nonomuraea sp. NPDC059007]|uniref:hypothetical protein n=1 Tax=Nonomuraea sp. NPDC059007 TaxID=3346692 RepID=UPI0036A51A11